MKISLLLFKIRGFEGRIRVPKHGVPCNSTGVGLLNHQTSKFSLFCLINQNLWMRILNLRFRRGNWATNVWGTLELLAPWFQITTYLYLAFLLIESKSVGGCLQFEDLKEELGPQRFGDSKISPKSWFQITKPLNLAYCVWWVKICWWVFAIWGFEGGIRPWTCRELQNFALGPQFDITKYLYLANLAQWATITVQGFGFEALMVVLDPTVWGTSKFHRGLDFK
jgi:hypothetical protein